MEKCRICGNDVSGKGLCPSCKKSEEQKDLLARQEIAAASETGSKKRFFLKPLFIVIALLIIGGAAGAAIYLNNSPKELYLISEYNTINQAKEQLEERYGDTLDFQKEMLEKPSRSEMDMSATFEMAALESDPNGAMVKEILDSASISLVTESNPEKSQSHINMALNMEKEPALDVDVVQTEKLMGLRVPALYEKFFYFNLDEYGDLMRMIDPEYTGPETMQTNEMLAKDFQLTEKEQMYLKKRYAEFFNEQLKDEQFELKKGVAYKHKDEEMKLRELTFKLTPEETKALLDNFLDHMIKDKELHSMIVKRVELFVSAAELGSEMDIPETKELKTILVEMLEELKTELKDVNFSKGFTSKILIDNNELIVDRKVTMSMGSGEEQANILIATKNIAYDEKEFSEMKIELAPENEEGKLTILVSNDAEVKKESRTDDMKAVFSFDNDMGNNELKFTMKSDTKGAIGSKQDITRKFNLDLGGLDLGTEMPSIKGTIKEKNEVNMKKEISNQNYVIEVNVDDSASGESGKIILNLDSKSRLKAKADIPTWDTDTEESINIMEMTPEEAMDVQQQAYLKLMELGEKYGLLPAGYSDQGLYYDDGMMYEEGMEYEDEEYYYEEEIETESGEGSL